MCLCVAVWACMSACMCVHAVCSNCVHVCMDVCMHAYTCVIYIYMLIHSSNLNAYIRIYVLLAFLVLSQ